MNDGNPVERESPGVEQDGRIHLGCGSGDARCPLSGSRAAVRVDCRLAVDMVRTFAGLRCRDVAWAVWMPARNPVERKSLVIASRMARPPLDAALGMPPPHLAALQWSSEIAR